MARWCWTGPAFGAWALASVAWTADHVGGSHDHPATSAQAPSQDTIYFRYCAGAILRAHPEAEPGTFALALLRGEAWKDYGRAIYDAEGRMLRQEVTGRGTVTYQPHNCEKVAGICTYTETGLDGEIVSKLRINGLTGAEWNYSLIDVDNGTNTGIEPGNGGLSQTLTKVGTVTYAPDGLAIRETWSSVTGTEDGCLERIDAADLPPGAPQPDATRPARPQDADRNPDPQ